MNKPTIALNDVIYNAAAQSFEARATLHSPSGIRTFACAIDAPITMSFEDAARGLTKQALRRDRNRTGLRSRFVTPAVAATRAARGFDPFSMLRRLAA